jgi:hypothetical protein
MWTIGLHAPLIIETHAHTVDSPLNMGFPSLQPPLCRVGDKPGHQANRQPAQGSDQKHTLTIGRMPEKKSQDCDKHEGAAERRGPDRTDDLETALCPTELGNGCSKPGRRHRGRRCSLRQWIMPIAGSDGDLRYVTLRHRRIPDSSTPTASQYVGVYRHTDGVADTRPAMRFRGFGRVHGDGRFRHPPARGFAAPKAILWSRWP